jgi:hypothetical protein
MFQLSEELSAAQRDGTLPDVLSVEQVWIDQHKRLKLLGAPLYRPDTTDIDTTHAARPSPERAVAVLREVMALLTKRQVLPRCVRELARELQSRRCDGETLSWATAQLRETVKQSAAVTWNERLGTLAISMGTELIFYWFAAAFIAVPSIMASSLMPSGTTIFFANAPTLFMPALVGLLCRGGPVSSLTGIEVLRQDGCLASRWRCGWRNSVAWLPVTVVAYVTMFAVLGC